MNQHGVSLNDLDMLFLLFLCEKCFRLILYVHLKARVMA